MNAARILAMAAVSLAATAHADTPVAQVGFTNGDDWEPAIAVEGAFVYAAWAHFGPPQRDSSGATCKTKGVSSYAYFQRSTNGGATFDPFIIPRAGIFRTARAPTPTARSCRPRPPGRGTDFRRPPRRRPA